MYINLLLMGAGGNISWWRNHPLPTAALSTPCPEGGVGKENMGTTGSFVSGTGDIVFDTFQSIMLHRQYVLASVIFLWDCSTQS